MQRLELTTQQPESVVRRMVLRSAVLAVLIAVSVAITTAVARALGFAVAGVWAFVLYWSSYRWIEPTLAYEFNSAWNHLMLIVTSLVASVLSGLTYLALGQLVNMTSSTRLVEFFWRDYESPVEAFLRVSLIAIWPLAVVQPVLLALRWVARRHG